MIPEFPRFRSMCMEDADVISALMRELPPYSDYTFTSLWVWGGAQQRHEISLLHGNLVVRFTDYLTGEPFYSFLGVDKAWQTASALLEFSAAMGLPAELHLIPERSAQALGTDRVSVCEDQASSDYIYSAAQHSQLLGGPFKSKRAALRAFEADYANQKFELMPLRDARAQEIVREITRSWTALKGGDALEGITHENEAIELSLELAKRRELWLGVVSIDDVATSFSVEELTHPTWSVSHFCKFAARRRGENEYLCREMASNLLKREVAHLNWQQDLGIESLRASKQSFRPIAMLKKFILTSAPVSVRSHSIKPPSHW